MCSNCITLLGSLSRTPTFVLWLIEWILYASIFITVKLFVALVHNDIPGYGRDENWNCQPDPHQLMMIMMTTGGFIEGIIIMMPAAILAADHNTDREPAPPPAGRNTAPPLLNNHVVLFLIFNRPFFTRPFYTRPIFTRPFYTRPIFTTYIIPTLYPKGNRLACNLFQA